MQRTEPQAASRANGGAWFSLFLSSRHSSSRLLSHTASRAVLVVVAFAFIAGLFVLLATGKCHIKAKQPMLTWHVGLCKAAADFSSLATGLQMPEVAFSFDQPCVSLCQLSSRRNGFRNLRMENSKLGNVRNDDKRMNEDPYHSLLILHSNHPILPSFPACTSHVFSSFPLPPPVTSTSTTSTTSTPAWTASAARSARPRPPGPRGRPVHAGANGRTWHTQKECRDMASTLVGQHVVASRLKLLTWP